MQRLSNIRQTYSKMSDDEILRLATQRESLTPLEKEVLRAEIQKRGLESAAAVSFGLSEEEAVQREKRRWPFRLFSR